MSKMINLVVLDKNNKLFLVELKNDGTGRLLLHSVDLFGHPVSNAWWNIESISDAKDKVIALGLARREIGFGNNIKPDLKETDFRRGNIIHLVAGTRRDAGFSILIEKAAEIKGWLD